MLHSWSLDSMTEAMIGPAQELCGFFRPTVKTGSENYGLDIEKIECESSF
jgi:hypothetical protein